MRDRIVLITGGGSGIGRAAALQFASAGANVVITGRRAPPLEATAHASDRILAIQADILLDSDRQRLVQTTVEHWGRIDVLVNNAGAFLPGGLDQIDAATANALLATNLLAPTLLSQAALPYLKKCQGSIVNVSSTFGHKAAANISLYAASKAALEHLTRCWALELAPHRVRVNAVAPGPTDTEILERSGLPAAEVDRIQSREATEVPLGRRGRAEEIAPWIVRLSDPTATWLTGQILAIDGGLSIA